MLCERELVKEMAIQTTIEKKEERFLGKSARQLRPHLSPQREDTSTSLET